MALSEKRLKQIEPFFKEYDHLETIGFIGKLAWI